MMTSPLTLTGAQLDWAAAVAAGHITPSDNTIPENWSPSTNFGQAAFLMHSSKMIVIDRAYGHQEDIQPILRFRAYTSKCEAFAPTANVALCRCFVLHKLGATLHVPEMIVKSPVFVDPKDCANPKVVYK